MVSDDTDARAAVGTDAAPAARTGAGAGGSDARRRIIAAAMARVAESGTAGASVRAIAAEADVSPALVLHHFGTKAGLLDACDDHLLGAVRQRKSDALATGPSLDVLGGMAAVSEELVPLVRYLARRLTEGGAAMASLVDRIVADAHEYVRIGIDSGYIRPSAHERDRTVLLTLWSLGALVLHEQAERLLGCSTLAGSEGVERWSTLAMEVLAGGILTQEAMTMMDAAAPGPEDR
jgi:AcrR family transcriptional regulator